MKKRVKVIMLPTEDSTSIIKLATSSTLYYYSSPTSAATKHLYVNQHLYFIDCRKVIASTEKLVDVPLIPQEFIENYCEVGGIDEVEIEYGLNYDEHPELIGNPTESWDEIKVDSNNCVMVHPIKDSWNKEEVEKLIESAVHDFAGMNTYDDDNLTKWINKNL